MPVHRRAATRTKTASHGVRLPVVLWKQIETIQATDGDETRNDTIRKALEAFVNGRMRMAA